MRRESLSLRKMIFIHKLNVIRKINERIDICLT
jgi:hypothetical protein